MNLGPQKISETYQLVLNQSGSSVTLGDGNNPNWVGTTVASATGDQTISGTKTFVNTINANITGSAGSATTATRAELATGVIVTSADGNNGNIMYPALFPQTYIVGINSKMHLDTGLSFNAQTNVLTASGGFNGNASSATILSTSRTINGTGFNGSQNITIEPYIENDTSAVGRYLTFVDQTGNGYQRLNTNQFLKCYPDNGKLSVGGIVIGNTEIMPIASSTTVYLDTSVEGDVFAFRDSPQIFSKTQTFSSGVNILGNLDCGETSLTGSGASSFFKTNAGQLGITSGNTINLASIGFNSADATSLSFIARRQQGGETADTSSIGLTYNVNNTTGTGSQEIWMLPNGNIGLGKNNPTQKLEVQGNLKVNGSIECSGVNLSYMSAKLNSDVDIRYSDSGWYNILSGTLSSGTWLLNSSLHYLRTGSSTLNTGYCRLSDLTTHYASALAPRNSTAGDGVNLNLTTIIQLSGSKTIYLQALQNTTAQNFNAAVVKASGKADMPGLTQFTAVRIA